MHLTPIQRLEVVRIYSRLIPGRSVNRARVTSRKAARKDLIISEKGVLRIMKKNKPNCNFFHFRGKGRRGPLGAVRGPSGAIGSIVGP